MNKDAILATIIGFFIGLLITGLLLVGPKLMKSFPKIAFSFPSMSQSKPKAQPKKEKPITFTLKIDSPLPDSIESEADLLVSGSTSAGATVIIQGNNSDDAMLVKADGKYAGKVALVEGKNDITVTSYFKGETTAQTVTVYYTAEAL